MRIRPSRSVIASDHHHERPRRDAERTPATTPSQRREARPVAALLAPDILEMLAESPGAVAAETEELHPANLADIASTLEPAEVARLLRALPPSRAADVLAYLDEDLRVELLEALDPT